jgi:RecA/RadA recombinase
LVVGEQGSGKTAFCLALVAAARVAHPEISAAGVMSPGLFVDGAKVGIEVESVASGERRLLALPRLPGGRPGEVATPGWRFELGALAWGEDLLARAIPCDLLMVDEMGPLEFEMGQGWLGGIAAVDSGRYGSAFVTMRPALVAKALDKWPEAELVRVTGREQAVACAEEMALRLG